MKILATITAILAGLLIYVSYQFYQSETHIWDLQKNIKIKNSTIVYFKTKSDMNAARVNVEKYTIDEIKDDLAQRVLSELKKLDLKPKYITNYNETVLQNDKEIITNLRDSIIRKDVPAEIFNYSDKYYNISGIAYNDTQAVFIHSIDTLIQVATVRPLHWFWPWGKKVLEQNITNKNPFNKIVYARSIEIKN